MKIAIAIIMSCLAAIFGLIFYIATIKPAHDSQKALVERVGNFHREKDNTLIAEKLGSPNQEGPHNLVWVIGKTASQVPAVYMGLYNTLADCKRGKLYITDVFEHKSEGLLCLPVGSVPK